MQPSRPARQNLNHPQRHPHEKDEADPVLDGARALHASSDSTIQSTASATAQKNSVISWAAFMVVYADVSRPPSVRHCSSYSAYSLHASVLEHIPLAEIGCRP